MIRKAIRLRVPNRRNRLAWCRGKLYLPVIGYWDRVVFSDESKVETGANKRVYIWRKVREEWKPECMNTPPKKFGVMVWGCISYNGVGTLAYVKGTLNAQGYQDILEKHLWPIVAKYFPSEDFIFQDDNAPVHRARCTVEYKLRNKIKSLSWPAQSPDINIIENIWLRLKNALQRNIDAITSVDELKTAITTAWMNVPNSYIHWLYNSIPRRLRAVVTSKGNITKY